MSDTGGTTTTTTTSTPPAWFAGLDPEHVGHVQTKGWDKLDASAAAVEMAKAHRAAEKFTGAPADQLLRLPKDTADDAGWKAIWQRLGAPDKPEGYDFSGVEFEEADATAAFHGKMREAAVKLNVPAPMARELTKAAHDYLTSLAEAADTETAARVQAEETALKQNWGSNFEANKFVSERGQQALAEKMGARLGVKVGDAAKLLTEAGMGEFAAEMFRVIGAGYGEDKFVRDPGPGGRTAMTRDQAIARRTELLGDGRRGSGDQEFIKRYSSGDAQARREVDALNLLIVSGA